MKNEQRRLCFKMRGVTVNARTKRTKKANNDILLQTIHALDDLSVISTSLVQDDHVVDHLDCSSSRLHSNFKERVEDLLLDGTRTILITSLQRQELTSEINQDYTEILLQAALDDPVVDVHLRAATHVVDEFLALQDVVLKKATMPSSMQDVLFEVLEDFLVPRVSFHFNMPIIDKLSPRDAARIVTWIDDFGDRLIKECPELELRQSWAQDRERLVQHYLDQGVRSKMNEVLTRAMELLSNQDVRQESQGHLVTGFPEQVAFMYEQQLKVARDLLPCKYQEVVLAACNDELANCVRCYMQLELMTGWKKMRSSYLCALLNDATRLSEQCEERNNLVLQKVEFQENGQDLVRDLTELSLDITRFLCEYMMNNLREPESILTSVGSVEWERNERPCAVDRTIATFEDFFADLEQWIHSSQYFFPKVLQHCFEMTLRTYLESFFANTMTKGVAEPAQVARVLKTDHSRLKDFFHGSCICESYHGSGGFHKQRVISDRLSILQSLVVLVDPTTRPVGMKNDIKVILFHFESGVNGAAVVLHLLGLRKRHQSLESIEWLKAIASALKELDKSATGASEEKKRYGKDNRIVSSANSSSSFTVPDLRNSKYLHHIRPRRSEVPRRISANSLPYADATLRLLQSRAITSAVQHRILRLPHLLSYQASTK